MKLSEFLHEEKISVAAFAGMLGVARVTIYDYLKGKKKPSEENMVAIARLTSNRVTPNDFYELPNLCTRTKYMEESKEIRA